MDKILEKYPKSSFPLLMINGIPVDVIEPINETENQIQRLSKNIVDYSYGSRSNTTEVLEQFFCRKCGKKIPLDSSFCPYCGYKLK